MRISFFGGVGTVTGSKYLLEANGRRILVDCGLFQGFKQLRLRNWEPLPVDPGSVDVVVLTHAHLDHSGYLPLLVRNGFKGPAFCTAPTRDLCEVLLTDAGYLEERDADSANRYGYSKHKPALPLFTEADARAAIGHLKPRDWDKVHDIGGGVTLTFRHAGHILGASMVMISDGERSILFSGDLGRPNDPLLNPPVPIGRTDYLVVESTYGDRSHDALDVEELLADIITRTARRGGHVIIPAFAVGRAQRVLHHVARLKALGRIPQIPIFLDSPMAIDASAIFEKYAGDHRLSGAECRALFGAAQITRTAAESKSIDENHMPSVIISASGMATGGRVLHHLKAFAPDPKNAIVFAGFQAAGTRGAAMLAGAGEIKIHGAYVPILAEVINLSMLSAHADANEIMGWLHTAVSPPIQTFVTHGEPGAADSLRHRIEEGLGWSTRVPTYRDSFTL